MKIYHKKNFYAGIVFLTLAILNLRTLLLVEFTIKDMILTLFLFCFAFSGVSRSLSKQCSNEDVLKENDERNKLINLKSKAKSYSIVEKMLLIIGWILTLFGAIKGESYYLFVGIGISLSLLWVIIIFIESCINIYYEKHE